MKPEPKSRPFGGIPRFAQDFAGSLLAYRTVISSYGHKKAHCPTSFGSLNVGGACPAYGRVGLVAPFPPHTVASPVLDRCGSWVNLANCAFVESSCPLTPSQIVGELSTSPDC